MGFVFDQNLAYTVAKEQYQQDDVDVLILKSPAIGMMPKQTDGHGQHFVGNVNTGITSSISTNDQVAFTTGNASQYARFVIPWATHYASANISGQAVRMCADKGAMIDLIVQESDNCLGAIGEEQGQEVWGYGGASIGVVNGVAATTTNTAGDTIVIATPQVNGINFYPGMIIQSSANNGTSGAVRPGNVTLLSADMNTGTLVANVAWASGITGFAVTDNLFKNGENGGSVGSSFAPGIPAIIPSVANRPTSTDNFNGVNRSIAPVQLAGFAYNGNGADMQETLTSALILGAKFGQPDKLFFSQVDYANLMRGLTGRVQYVMDGAFESNVGFEGVKINTGRGPVTCYVDPYVPQGTAWALTMEDWIYKSLGEVPQNLTEQLTGLTWLPQTTSNTFIQQLGYFGTFFCRAPRRQIAITF